VELQSSTEYPRIETLYERDPVTHKVMIPVELKNPVYGLLKAWEWTEKIDGTNIRCLYRPPGGGGLGPTVEFRGRTDNAQVHPKLYEWLRGHILPNKLAEIFPLVPVVLYGEGCGAGIQKGGVYGPEPRFVLFDIRVGERNWLGYEMLCETVAHLGDVSVVPYYGMKTLAEAVREVQNGVRGLLGPEKYTAEGLVGRPQWPLFDARGRRLICKLKTRDFAPELLF
jgi:hypothetical protein